jgi:hypothetical protein
MSLAAILIAGMLAQPTPTPHHVVLTDPYAVVDRAREVWRKQHYPGALQYTIAIAAKRLGQADARHYSVWWFAATNAVAVDTLSAEEAAHPYKPSPGVRFEGVWNIGGPRVGTGVNGDLLGVPMLTPNYAFGIVAYEPPHPMTPAELVAEVRREFRDPAPEKVAKLAAASGLGVIATVTSVTRDYDMKFVGIEGYGDHRDYHITLVPMRDPERYRLRELWIDADSFATDKLVAAGNFDSQPASRVPWTVTFHQVDGAQYIDREVAASTLCQGFSVMNRCSPGNELREFTVMFEDIAPNVTRPVDGTTTGAVLLEPKEK